MNHGKEAAFVLLSGSLTGIISLFSRPLVAAGLEPLQVSAVRICLSAVIFLIFTLVRNPAALKVRIRDLWMFFCPGTLGLASFSSLYLYTVEQIGASTAVVLLYTAPIIVMVLSIPLFHETMTRRKAIALIMAMAGIVLVSGILNSSGGLRPTTLATGLGSGLAYAIYILSSRIAARRYGSMTSTVYSFLFAGLTMSLSGRLPLTIRQVTADPHVLLLGLCIAVICCVIPFFLYNAALTRLESSKASILSCIELVVGSVTGIAVFGEDHSLMKAAGMLLILSAIVILNLREPAAMRRDYTAFSSSTDLHRPS